MKRSEALAHVILLATLSLLLLSPAGSRAESHTGWFIGGGFSMFEPSLTGDLRTIEGDVEFDAENQNAYSLITNAISGFDNGIGLGWEGKQLPGGKLIFGYRHNFHFVTHVDMFWALSKTEQLQGFPNQANPTQSYLEQQATRFSLNTTRLMLDWRPFEPLPLFYMTFGVEYASFRTRLEFRFQQPDQSNPNRVYRFYESYEDAGIAFGGVIGAGLQFGDAEYKGTEWYLNFNYSYTPFTDAWFAWDGDFLVGGAMLEGGMRVYLGGRDDKDKRGG